MGLQRQDCWYRPKRAGIKAKGSPPQWAYKDDIVGIGLSMQESRPRAHHAQWAYKDDIVGIGLSVQESRPRAHHHNGLDDSRIGNLSDLRQVTRS